MRGLLLTWADPLYKQQMSAVQERAETVSRREILSYFLIGNIYRGN